MVEVEFARWATDEEVKKLKTFFLEKRLDKDEFTTKWLSTNGDLFLELHDRFDVDFFNSRYKERVHDLRKLNIRYIDESLKYIKIKSGEKVECECGGVLKIVSYQGSEFVGCSNYKNESVTHTRVYQRVIKEIPSLYDFKQDFIEQKESYKDCVFPSTYINEIKNTNNLPKELKMSILIEFLLMHNRDLYNPKVLDHVSKITQTGRTSKKREHIILPILQSLFTKAEGQKAIYYRLKGEKRNSIKFPDFVAHDGKSIFLFEQKKSEFDANINQINLYEKVIAFIAKGYPIKKYFIFEEETDKIEIDGIRCLTIKNLRDEFC
jgi:ssDNA-binding Zn-finger/Zn-ribbon topoisomerase 1